MHSQSLQANPFTISKVHTAQKPTSVQRFESPRQEQRPIAKHQFSCQCVPSPVPLACDTAYKWYQIVNKSESVNFRKGQELYNGLKRIEDSEEELGTGSQTQIQLDLCRTIQSTQVQTEKRVANVLLAFSKYDNTIGYVQGMNHIVEVLIRHCSEEIAFWLFVSLVEDHDLRSIYQVGLPGLYRHVAVLSKLLELYLPKLNTHLEEAKVTPVMFASNWLFTLFCNTIPIEAAHKFLDQFFKHGWAFWYQFTMTYLQALQSRILSIDREESQDIMELIKTPGKFLHNQEMFPV